MPLSHRALDPGFLGITEITQTLSPPLVESSVLRRREAQLNTPTTSSRNLLSAGIESPTCQRNDPSQMAVDQVECSNAVPTPKDSEIDREDATIDIKHVWATCRLFSHKLTIDTD